MILYCTDPARGSRFWVLPGVERAMASILRYVKPKSPHRLTLFGRAVLLVAGEIAFNAICWIAAGLTLGQADGLIGLALLAWVSYLFVTLESAKADNPFQTIGLRHGMPLSCPIILWS